MHFIKKFSGADASFIWSTIVVLDNEVLMSHEVKWETTRVFFTCELYFSKSSQDNCLSDWLQKNLINISQPYLLAAFINFVKHI